MNRDWLSPDVAGVVILFTGNPLDFHSKILSTVPPKI